MWELDKPFVRVSNRKRAHQRRSTHYNHAMVATLISPALIFAGQNNSTGQWSMNYIGTWDWRIEKKNALRMYTRDKYYRIFPCHASIKYNILILHEECHISNIYWKSIEWQRMSHWFCSACCSLTLQHIILLESGAFKYLNRTPLLLNIIY